MQSFSRLMAFSALLRMLSPALATYMLQDDYSGSAFFDKFDFFTANDPTNGYVDYVSQSAAQAAGLISTNNNQIYMGVDSTNVASGRGRQSVRLTSKASYNHGLIVLDLEHMPGSICGVWPAFWTVGPNWPYSGEIDIIEGVNRQNHNAMTLHTQAGCSISSSYASHHRRLARSGNTSPNLGPRTINSVDSSQLFSGTVQTSNCDVHAAGQAQNVGCGITTTDTSTYGDGLNAINGGVYATEWTSDAIKIWFFPRSSIPSDISSGNPNPSAWGLPLAAFFKTSCNIDGFFKNNQIVFDTTFCGDWAGSVWSQDSTCAAKADTCQDYVMNNPSAFKDAYWSINSLKVYTGSGSAVSSHVSVSSLPPNGSTTGPVPVSVSRSQTHTPTASESPCIWPLCSSAAARKSDAVTPSPSAAVGATTATSSQTGWAGQSRHARADHTDGWGQGQATRRSAAEVLGPHEPLTDSRPVARSDNDDLQLVRRHMREHKRLHGGRL